MEKYSKEQIRETIKYWRNRLREMNESEDTVDQDTGILRSSARDMIFDDAECLGSEVEVRELWLPSFGARGHMPVTLTKKEIDTIKNLQDRSDGYRVLVYIYTGKNIEPKWSTAASEIDGRYDYNDYVDPESENNRRYPEEFDAEFAKAFPTYESWEEYVKTGNEQALRDLLTNSGKSVYKYAADNVRTDPDGITYTLIVWRA